MNLQGIAGRGAGGHNVTFQVPIACQSVELFSTFLLTGFREQEVAFLFWNDINLRLRTIRVTSKPHLGFSPKRWEEREIPIPVQLAKLLGNVIKSDKPSQPDRPGPENQGGF
jgi:hypothetical protein